MYGSRLGSALAAVFGGIAVLFVAFAIRYNLIFLGVAVLFTAVAYFMWYHASGRLAARIYRGVEGRARVTGNGARKRGGFDAGPRERWTPPGEERSRARSSRRQRTPRGSRADPGRSGFADRTATGPSASEAARVLGVDRDADEATVTAAYREKVKEVHPDRPGGDEARFKAVQAAYERLARE